MKGLLIKDFNLILTNKKVLLATLAVGVMMVVMGTEMVSFVVGYVTLICAFQVLTTITYDTYDHSDIFLMTLPVTRKKYVEEKYVFSIVCMFAGWGVSMTIAFLIQMTAHEKIDPVELWAGGVAVLAVGFLILGVSIPAQLKFVGENGKMIVMAVAVSVMLAGFIVMKLSDVLEVDLDASAEWVFETNGYLLFAVMAGIVIVVYLISFLFSLRIMKRKEF